MIAFGASATLSAQIGSSKARLTERNMLVTYTIYGGLGSPYSMKMRAILRYRRLPHIWIQLNDEARWVFTQVKAPVIPVIQYPDGTWHNDSTPMVYELEARHPGERSVIPSDEAQAFLAFLLEDMADEWGTKAMFHYRWFRERDQKQMSEWLAFDRLVGKGRNTILTAARQFRERQVSRMALVGCTEQNAALIEETARRVLSLFEEHVMTEPYLFGTRPSLADFAWMGQFSQLIVDPTPTDVLRRDFPFTVRWLMNLDDASGIEGEWRDSDMSLSPAVRGLLSLAGEVYLPFLIANANAAQKGEETFKTTLLGKPYEQGTFRYQVKCLAELRTAYARLQPAARARVDNALAGTDCRAILVG
jgi:glutathione S-transferase